MFRLAQCAFTLVCEVAIALFAALVASVGWFAVLRPGWLEAGYE